MKKISLLLIAAAVLFACQKEQPVQPEVNITPAKALTLPAEGSEDFTVEFKANVDWTAALEGVDAANPWCSISPASGKAGQASVKVVALKNDTDNERKVTLVITAGEASQSIDLIQPAVYVPGIESVTEALVFEAEGGTQPLTLRANVPVKAEVIVGSDWLSVTATKALSELSYTVTAAAYDRLDVSREGAILIIPVDETLDNYVVAVSQEGVKTKIWSVDMTEHFELVANASYDGISLGAMPSIAIVGDKIVVSYGDGEAPVILDKATGAKVGNLDTKGVKVHTVANDDAGHLVLCNRNAYDPESYWYTDDFNIYVMTSLDAAPVKLCSAEKGPLGMSLVVRGDVTGNAAILAPWEGIPGVACDNETIAWKVEGGVAGDFFKVCPVGFVGLNWAQGYWNAAPGGCPAIALMSADFADGGVVGAYDENSLYSFDANGSCSLVCEKLDDGNNTINSADIRDINGKAYCAVCAGCYFPQWGIAPVVKIIDTESWDVKTLTNTQTYFAGDTGVNEGAAVVIEAAEGGLNVYFISCNCCAIEGIFVPLD